MALAAGTLDRRIRIERAVADDSFDGAGSAQWQLVTNAWAQVRDTLPSRGEQLADGINIAKRPARVRIRYRDGITPDMRFVMGATVTDDGVDYSSARIMEIISGPAEIGRREQLEFMVEDYTSAGSSA